MNLTTDSLIPIIGGAGVAIMLLGFSLRERRAGPALMLAGMALTLGMLSYKIYLTLGNPAG